MHAIWVKFLSLTFVALMHTLYSQAQFSSTERHPIFLSTNSLFNLSGTVTKNNFETDSVVVYIYREQEQGTVELVDSAHSFGINGKYSFNKMVSGTYYLRAKHINMTKGSIDTYYGGSAVWIDSKAIILRQDMTNKSISLEKESDFKGNASISGNVEYGSGDINFPIGDKAINIPVVIMQNGVVIRRIVTDSQGNFKFNNIPIMNYYLVVDYPGKSMASHIVRLNSSETDIKNQNFTLEKSTVNYKGTVNSIEIEENKKLKVYPNPCTNIIHLKNIKDIKTYKIIDYTGKAKLEGRLESLLSIDMTFLESGIYFLLLDGDSEREVIRVTKK